MTVAARLRAVRGQVAAAAAAAGRAAADVTLVAVSKRQPLAAVCAAYDAGARDFGENLAQDMLRRAAALAASGRSGARWHFVGRLQRNKAAAVARLAHLVHSVDRAALLAGLAAPPGAPPTSVLVQVNLGAEPQKGGVAPADALQLAHAVSRHARLALTGLMAVPPAGHDPVPYFGQLAELHRDLRGHLWGAQATALSMGMSDDFVAAIACGATLVRVGSAIFGARPAPPERP